MRTFKMKRRSRRSLALGLATIWGACGAGGCGSSASTRKLDTVTLERAIAESILTEKHIYTLVSCPASTPQQEGRKFTCEAKLTVGTYPIYVTETNRSGHVRYGNQAALIALNTSRVARAIEASVLGERHLHARVSCPSGVLQQKGLTFTCTAKVGHKSYPFKVSEIDSDGHVHYVGE